MSATPHPTTEHSKGAPPTWREALRFWFWLGCMSFGGPAGQIALMHEELVVRRRWISEKRYLHALHYCMLLPGPEAQQLATYTGWLMHGTRGGIAAGALFVLPSLVLLMVLSWAYTAWGQHPWGQALLWGLKPAVTALVLKAAHRLALGETTPGPLIMVVAFVGFLGGHSQALFGHPVLGGIVAACVVTWFTFLPSFVFILAGGPLVESTRHMPSLAGPLQGITAAVIGVIVHLAGVFARQTWLPGGWHMLPDLGAVALTLLATWLLIRQQLSVFKLLGLCTALGLVWQLLV